MEETYGLQDQRSNSSGFMVFGSRRAKSSSGFVSALTYSLRYCPDFPMYCCTIESEVTTALSSGEPLVKIPVTLRESPPDVEVERYNGLPISTAFLSAKAFPTMHSPAPSSNQEPSTRHHGFVSCNPVMNSPPSGKAIGWFDHVPINTESPSAAGLTKVADAGDQRGVDEATLTSRIGANPVMLLCQKIVLSFGRSASGRYAPAFTGR